MEEAGDNGDDEQASNFEYIEKVEPAECAIGLDVVM